MEFLVLKPTLEAVDIIDTYESAIWTDRYSKCGDFELYTPVDNKYLDLLRPGYYLWSSESEHVMIVEDRQITTDVEEGINLVITGRSLESILDRRIVWNQTLLTGNFQNGIKKLLDENVISPTITNRRISNFVFEASTDPIITSLTIDTQFTGDNLYTVISDLCSAKGIGFKILLTEDNLFKFKLYSGVNRSYNQSTNPYVVFSPNFENLINSNYLESTKTLKTVTLVAGEGEGINRKTESVEITSGGGSGLSRREMYTDARDVSSNVNDVTLTPEQYTQQLVQRGKDKLSENILTQSFEGQAETTRMFKYGKDFYMGDIVQIANEYDMESKSRVVELISSKSSSGITVVPTFVTI